MDKGRTIVWKVYDNNSRGWGEWNCIGGNYIDSNKSQKCSTGKGTFPVKKKILSKYTFLLNSLKDIPLYKAIIKTLLLGL